MNCPKCNVEQPDADECAACGIVVSRFRSRAGAEASRPGFSDAPVEPVATPTDKAIWLVIKAVVIVLLLSAGLAWTSHSRAARAERDRANADLLNKTNQRQLEAKRKRDEQQRRYLGPRHGRH